MALFNGFSIGFRSFFKAISFIFQHKLWWVFAIPVLLNVLLYASGFAFMDYLGDITSTYLTKYLGSQNNSKWIEMLPGILAGIAKVLIQILFFFIFAYFLGYIILIVLSPLFAWLSERTEQIITGKTYPFSLSQFLNDIWRGIVMALRNMLYELGITILVLIASILPIVNIVLAPMAGIFLFIISSYFYGFSYMDYTSERKKLKVQGSIKLIRKYRGMAVAIGAAFTLTLLIPFCGLMLSGFTAIITTVAATLAMNEIPEIKNQLN